MMEKPFNKCRLCLKLGEFCSIFEQDESIKLSEMVMAFANVKIYEGDGLSDRVCTSCIENLSTAYLFKLQCERINSLLKQTPGIQLDHPPTSGFNEFINKDFYMHVKNDSIEGENNENYVKDNNTIKSPENSSYESNDDTDSDVDSIKCVYCNQAHNNYGSHKCHVTCTIEHDSLQQSSSNETLVATDITPQPEAMLATQSPGPGPETFTNFVNIPCVLCDDNFNEYDAYSIHLNKCTENVKLHHFVCPVCHEIYTEKLAYMEHLKIIHFKSYDIKSSQESQLTDPGVDIVDSIGPRYIKTSRPTKVRRQIGWSVEDIYQEIDVIKVDEKQTPTSSPFKTFFSKLGNESFSRSSTPKKVSFRKLIENGKAKTANCIPFKKYIDNYRNKKTTKGYSPIERKMQVTGVVKASLSGVISDSDYNSPGGTSEESWKLKQNLICACDKKVFMLSESIHDRDRIVSMVNELGGVVAENTKMEMLATHFISMLPSDTFTGMMVCSLATGKWLLHVSFIYDSFRCKKFMNESLYEWMKHPKILEIDNTSVEVARAAAYWHMELQEHNAKFPFEGKQIVLVMKKKYRQYYQMIFKTLKAKPMTYDPRTPGSCCNADYCFVDMKVIEKVKLKFFASHNVPVFPYQYILVFLLNRGEVADDHKYLLNGSRRAESRDTVDILINTY